jgi:hypothetical protein
MSNANTPSFPDFGKLVPGFDFLQNLTKQASGAAAQAMPQLPNLANWIAPTLSVEELDKRVQELKAVQFWLDQNATALKATIQALEVQKMTLATLKGMNFNMNEVANAFKLKTPDSAAGAAPRAAEKTEKAEKGKAFPGLEIPPSIFQASKAQAGDGQEAAANAQPPKAEPEEAPAAAAPAMADAMQWWGALTQQFQTIAAEAMKEAGKTSALDATKNLVTGIAKDAVKTATEMSTGLAKGMAETASKTVAGSVRAASALGGQWPQPAAAKTPPRAAPRAAASKAAAGKPAPSRAAAKKAPAGKKTAATARKTTR